MLIYARHIGDYYAPIYTSYMRLLCSYMHVIEETIMLLYTRHVGDYYAPIYTSYRKLFCFYIHVI